MKNKAVAFIRVSTKRQDTTQQREEVLAMIQNDGYSKENTIIIEVKASTIKLDEEYLNAINELEKVIEKGDVNCVYAWALNRITRKLYIATRFAEVLEKSKTKFKLLNPRMEIFSGTAEFSMADKMLICSMAQVAEVEMTLKRKDFARTKAYYKTIGKYCGGFIKFGYAVNNEKMFIVNDEEAKVIRFLFETYARPNYTISEVCAKAYELGFDRVFEQRKNLKRLTPNVVGDILADRAYIGETCETSKDLYPAIIEKELFAIVQKKRQSKNNGKTRQKHYYFASKLIVCTDCGSHFVTNNKLYRCLKHDKQMAKRGYNFCENKASISINVLDSLLWSNAKMFENIKLNLDSKDIEKHLTEQRDEIQKKIEVCNERILKLQKKEDDIEFIFLTTHDKDRYKKHINELKSEENEIRNQLEHLNLSGKQIVRQIENLNVKNPFSNIKEQIEELETMTNAKKMYELIHEHIDKVTIENFEKYKIVKIYPSNSYLYFNNIEYCKQYKVMNRTNSVFEILFTDVHGEEHQYKVNLDRLEHKGDEVIISYNRTLEERLKGYKAVNSFILGK